jgi:spermidine/putrescine transport system ATP-binding protein
MRNDLELDRVTKKFGDLIAVSQVSVTIPQGEFFSFLGPSGCGKTTILRMISGFIDPTGGEIRLTGRTLAGIGPNRRPTALIFQNLALFPLMSVAENIGYGLKVRGVPRSDRDRKVEQLLELTALRGYGPKRVDELSGGQKQRVAIARALAGSPSVILADEPTAALDSENGKGVMALLSQVAKDRSRAILVVTHDHRTLAYADRLVRIEDGRIVGRARKRIAGKNLAPAA